MIYDTRKREIQNFFAQLMVDLISQLYFYFVKVIKIAIGLIVSLAIGKAVLMRRKIIIGFFRLFCGWQQSVFKDTKFLI